MKNFSFLNHIKTTLKPGANQVTTTLTILLLLLGVGNVIGATCYVYEETTGATQSLKTGTIFETPVFENADGIDYISFTYHTPGTVGYNLMVQYSLDGGDHYTNLEAKGKSSKDKDVYNNLSGDITRANRFKFIVNGGPSTFSYEYAVKNIKIRKAPTLKLDATSYTFSETAVDGSASREFTISTWNTDAPSITKSGTNADQYSYSLSSASGSCPTEYTLTITYSPTAETTGESTHVASFEVAASGKSATVNVSGTAQAVATSEYSWEGENAYYVDDTSLDLSLLWTSTGGGAITYSISSFTPTDGTHTGSSAPVIGLDGKTLSLGKAGTLILGLSQEEGNGYSGGTDEKTIKINRRPNPMTANSTCKYASFMGLSDTHDDIQLDATNTNYSGSAIIVQQLNMTNDSVTYDYNSTTRKISVKSHVYFGTVKFEMSQPETYKYEAGKDTFSIEVKMLPEATNCYVLENQETEDKVWHGETILPYYWEDENAAGVVSFEVCYAKFIPSDQYIKVQEYVYTGSKWDWSDVKNGRVDDYSYDYVTKRITLSQQAKGVRFWGSGGIYNYIQNVSVTRKTYLTVPNVTINKQTDGTTLLYTNTEGKGNMVINYSLANGGKLKIYCDNSKFTFTNDKINATTTPLELLDYGCSTDVLNIPVFYSGNAAAGNESAEVLIYNDVYCDTVTISATIVKRPQTITWEPASLSAYTVDTVTLHASAVEQVIFSESSDVAALSIIEGDTLLTFTGASASVAVNANAAANDDYYAAEQVTKTWNVSLTPTTVTTAPTIAAYTYGEEYAINASAAVAKDEIKNKVVAGSYTVKEGEDVTSIGTRDIKLVFTPENTNMYESCECTVSITVNAVEKEFDPEDADPWADVDETSAVTIPEAKDVTIEEEVVVYSLTIEEGTTVTITPTGGLTIGDGGVSIKSEGKLVLKANTGSAKAEGYKGQTSYIVFSPDYKGEMPEATVEMYSVGYRDLSGASSFNSWQYVGVPVDEDSYAAKDVFPSSGVRSWNEAEDKWVNNRKTLNLEPFVGYATQQYTSAEGMMLTFDGQLAANRGSKTINLTKAGEGWNLIANSFAAPIDITKFDISDFGGATATIYIWDTESRDYIEVPVGTAKASPSDVDALVVPSMQGFFVQTSAATTLTLDYDKLVWGGEQINCPLRSKRRAPKQSNLSGKMRISLIGEDSQDDLTLLESEQYAKAYENGYDAPKKHGEGCSVYAIEDGMEMGFDATSNMDGTVLGIRSGSSDTYTLKFTNVQTDSELYLKDIYSAGSSVRISEGTEYTFYVSPNSTIDGRFEIVSSNAPAVATDIENGVTEQQLEKYIKNGQMFILKDGVKYNSIGQKIQ